MKSVSPYFVTNLPMQNTGISKSVRKTCALNEVKFFELKMWVRGKQRKQFLTVFKGNMLALSFLSYKIGGFIG